MDKLMNCTGFALLSILVFSTLYIFFPSINNIAAQHHGAPPPLAALGERNIKMNFIVEPPVPTAGQNSQVKMSLEDEKNGEKIQHVTYRVTLNKNDQIKVSDFFHSHPGEITLASKNTNSGDIRVEGTFDALTNAIIPDPSGTIGIMGPIFSEAGLYKADIEIITIDNDKTDLPNPLEYQFEINVK
jgi:hypothetical protein